ncbi:MAG: permease-like cell division protein FtsX [Eubacterium coprostanoligenes]|uniref:Cell division protein FtsX n=1 Tax=Eubacterium coprostanoligenes TaxID=290054 RepID=A0A1T4JUD8_9FIRM|nr:permease-like cell division protein FtsX [Eubacterium coprostanoligenes]MCI7265319.1 permease-like cell division protein FtsX [Eubacterium coprostanoligenes]MDD7357790.1 permease-like cell division protein FtsX [Eubacterium coprostanoligenes]MDY5376957.1 permease-like cell division protein FtsX [Eubacterium coprostanoligenes]SJZ33677.1 cell division transport system permease protein [Eubacterium coprostanoligenes]
MSGASFRYLIKEGFHNTWTNRMMSVASICVLLSCLLLIGSASMIFLNIDSLVQKIENENVIMVYIDDEATDADIDELGIELQNLNNVQKIEFVAKEDAWAEQIATMDEAQAEFFTEQTDEIPLPDAYKVTVKDLEQFTTTVKQIKKLNHIDTVRQNTDLAKKLAKISNGISIISIVIIAVLFAISLFIISNTIKLTVYSRRLEISIMKSVGATNSFVQLPFVVEGVILGVVAGVLSLFAVWGIYELAINRFGDVFSSIGLDPLKFTDYAWIMLGVFVAIGIVSGVGGSLITMRKYLTKEGSEISAV